MKLKTIEGKIEFRDAAPPYRQDVPESTELSQSCSSQSPEVAATVARHSWMWTQVANNLTDGYIAKYRAGKLLSDLNIEYAKPGYGTFVEHLESFANKCGVSTSTLRRRMEFYRNTSACVYANLLIQKAHEADLTKLPWASGPDFDLVAMEVNADEATAQVGDVIRAAAAKSKAALKDPNALPPLAIKFAGLSANVRTVLQTTVGQLREVLGGDSPFATWLLEAVAEELSFQALKPGVQQNEVQNG